jgi:hypothetical protein
MFRLPLRFKQSFFGRIPGKQNHKMAAQVQATVVPRAALSPGRLSGHGKSCRYARLPDKTSQNATIDPNSFSDGSWHAVEVANFVHAGVGSANPKSKRLKIMP